MQMKGSHLKMAFFYLQFVDGIDMDLKVYNLATF